MSGSLPPTPAMPAARMLRQGVGWHAGEYLCTAGRDDPVFEERHEAFTIAAVIQGSFRYRSGAGSALLYPGALLLGNHGECYECGHDHGRGDRCVAFHVEPEMFSEVAATQAGTGRFRFARGALPVLPELTPRFVRAHTRLAAASSVASDEGVYDFVEAVVAACSGGRAASPAARASAAEARRIGEVTEFIVRHASDALDLAQMASRAAMSKYHFLRVFRRVIGMTPYQFLIETRMRRAAERLLRDEAPIAAIAFEAGFGDLSTFNARFRRQFGRSPRAYRAGSGAGPPRRSWA